MERTAYSRGAIAFHWAIGVLMILNLAGGLLHESFGEAAVGPIMSLHKATGILILALSVGRLAWRLTHRPPPLAATVKAWEKGMAHAVHWIFYVLMIALPVTGWLMVSAGSRKFPIDFYGLFTVPWLPIAQDRAVAGTFNERHEVLGYVMIALIVLHIAGALKHHLIDRDNTLARILPLLRRRMTS
ncbi:MAG: cytochrome b [Sphingomonadaceae bacterium]